MSTIKVLGQLDPNFAWDGKSILTDADLAIGTAVPSHLRGAVAAVLTDGNDRWRLVRDPLGLNKLFWAAEADGSLAVAACPHVLTQARWSLDEIHALPRGSVCDLDGRGSEGQQQSIRPESWFSGDATRSTDLEHIAGEIRAGIGGYLEALAAAHPGSPVFVCLSGGLDSSGIAAMTCEHFSEVTAVTFDLARPGNEASDDRGAAQRLARDLGLPFLEAIVTADQLLANLDAVLIGGIDWRDFNVHAALVNAVLAATIRDSTKECHEGRSPIVLTGDLANEFLVDYHAEEYRGAQYYELPALSPAALRRSLIQGLDTCHREIGVFAAWNLALVQPYAAATDAYLALPESFLTRDDRKQELSRLIFDKQLPSYIYERPKVRAQMGSLQPGYGVLAACADHGVTAASLRRRFAELHQVEDHKALDRFIRAGRYRSKVPSLAAPDPGAEGATVPTGGA